ncbi:hypothetical protein QE450_001292 [Paenibacillus sp. SORGH_AS306]|uniref:hypothetical protein n=1 Tax=unclassified Paenibacillus TaxID=185978 RepID=UPI00277FF6A3|nr:MULTISPECIES: hypothetical protein [unclassified Paenibacillus]MDQ1233794.1 hypothetical protein [Paenibacillus sp. SORGH_AS_0306]MDR6110840.1 hypothetical protein [Paenibacillus sp. SORGH_AS_0338]
MVTDIFIADIPLVDGVIQQVILLPEQVKVYFQTEQGDSIIFSLEQVAAVWDRRSAGQEIGGMRTVPWSRTEAPVRDYLLAQVEQGELSEEWLSSLSMYSFVSSWGDHSILDIVASEIRTQRQ